MSALTDLQRDGWAALGVLLTEGELAELRAESERLVDHGAAQTGLSRDAYLRIVQQLPAVWRASPAFDALTRHPAILHPARQALGAERLRLLRQHLVIKPTRMAHELPWHQDLCTWPTTDPHRSVAVWVALDAASEQTGAIRYIPGSHRGQDADPVVVSVEAGGGLLHHALVWHASASNTTDTWRRAAIQVYAHPDAPPRHGAFDPTRHPLRG
jgi:ectoine hydroxylase-related dioxygenase (phytanoyl-CoA dioxygenase family)